MGHIIEKAEAPGQLGSSRGGKSKSVIPLKKKRSKSAWIIIDEINEDWRVDLMSIMLRQ